MRTPPAFETTTRLVARSLGIDAEDLLQGFRRARADDFDGVVTFRQQNFEEPIVGDDAAYLRWRYRFGRSDRGLGDLWVLEVNGRLLGNIGTEDLVICHAGARHAGIHVMDILIDRGVRSSGLGVWLNQALFREAAIVIAIGGNDRSIGTVRRLFAPLQSMKVWIQPLDIRRRLRKRWGNGVGTTVVSVVGNRLLRLVRDVRRNAVRGPWSIREIERFDEAVEGLFAPENSASVTFERGADYLNYRLFDNPRARYRAAGLYRDGVLVGCIAWRREVGTDGSSWNRVIDWRVRQSCQEKGAGLLLSHVEKVAELSRCDYVLQSRQGLAEAGMLRRSGFMGPREGRERICGLHAQSPALLATLLEAEWSMTMLEDDTDGT